MGMRRIRDRVRSKIGDTLRNAAIRLRRDDRETLTVIEPPSGWFDVSVRELWQYRELLYFLAWRDVKVRYKQTLLGAAWAIIQPVTAMVIFSIVFGRLADMPSDDVPYPIFVYAGLLPWQFFAGTLNTAANSLVGNRALVTKIYFPRLFLPTSAVGAPLLDLMLSFVVYGGLMVYYQYVPSQLALLAPVLIVLTAMASLGASYILSGLTVIYRDFFAVIPFLLQIWMYASPVVYPVSIFPEQYQWLVVLNPMAGIIDAFRAGLLGTPMEWTQLGISAAVAVAMFVFGLIYFRRLERRFADVI
ncbi:MAG: ABC transporter permease [Armatimonadota bacterium]|jgi:lipopolysaccharide transport system permease protein